ncbi:MAG: Crp/Fnr family transcriptional regulator [Dysosmobacter sp.]|nr:Crp/Fnr family transcriptional regulator [Dysosmobacter sp.]
MKTDDVLGSCPLFAGIGGEDLKSLLKCLGARTAAYPKKTVILSEGGPMREVGIVLSGTVQIVRGDYSGNRSIVAAVGPGELFGEAFACAGVKELPVDVVAREDAQVLLLDCQRLLRPCCNACGFHRQLIFNLVQVLARKNLALHQKLEILSRRSTREKLLTYLHQQAKHVHSRSFTIPYDRQELADYLEVERSGLSAEISRLRREGILESERSWFRLL